MFGSVQCADLGLRFLDSVLINDLKYKLISEKKTTKNQKDIILNIALDFLIKF